MAIFPPSLAWALGLADRPTMVAGCAAAVLGAAASLCVPALLGTAGSDPLLVLGAGALAALFGAVRCVCFHRAGAEAAHAVRTRLFRSLVVDRPISFFDAAATADLTARLDADARTLAAPLQWDLGALLGALVHLAGGLALCAWADWRLTLAALCVLRPLAGAARGAVAASDAARRRVDAALHRAHLVAAQALSGIRTVRASGSAAARSTLRDYGLAAGEALAAWRAEAWATARSVGLARAVDACTAALLVWYAQTLAFPLYWATLSAALATLLDLQAPFGRAAEAAQRVRDVLVEFDTPRRGQEAAATFSARVGETLDPTGNHGWTLDGVTFAYPGASAPVLADVSLHIPRGRVTALVGPSGGGKSTLVQLLLRFYAPAGGRILRDGIPYEDLDWPAERDRIAYVAQGTELFDDTVWNNVVYGAPHPAVDEAAVHAACRRAHAHEFILRLPDGYATRVGERGGRLSGGQRQRLALARALLRGADLLLLDEATAGLDPACADAVQAALDDLVAADARTAIVLVTHRPPGPGHLVHACLPS